MLKCEGSVRRKVIIPIFADDPVGAMSWWETDVEKISTQPMPTKEAWISVPCSNEAVGMVREGYESRSPHPAQLQWPACLEHLVEAGQNNCVPLEDILTTGARDARTKILNHIRELQIYGD